MQDSFAKLKETLREYFILTGNAVTPLVLLPGVFFTTLIFLDYIVIESSVIATALEFFLSLVITGKAN